MFRDNSNKLEMKINIPIAELHCPPPEASNNY